MRIESVPVGLLKPYDNNAKRHTNEQVDAVKESIRRFGFRVPIVAWHDEDGQAEIVAGHCRAMAALALGMDEVPVAFCDDLTDAERRALTLVDNQTSMMTGWDDELLRYELDVLSDNFEVASFGFDLPDGGDGVAMPDDSEASEGVTVTIRFSDEDAYASAMESIQRAAKSVGAKVSVR